MIARILTPAALIAALSSCAIYPLPEDVTGINTVNLVNHIRCEARLAINTAIAKYLSVEKSDAVAQTLSAQLLAGEIYDPNQDYNLSARVRKNVSKYMPAAITYDFTFDMTETNNLGLNATFLGLVTGGALTYAGAASNNLTRENNRNFFISDEFGRLLTSRQMAKYCRDYVANINFEYPISGAIGLEKPIETFINLNEFEDLSTKDKSSSPAPVMADTLKFTTAISGSLTPSVVIAGARAGFSTASAAPAIGRTDMHQVIIALTLPIASKAGPEGAAPLAASAASGKSSAAARGEVAVQQQRMNKFYDSSLIILK